MAKITPENLHLYESQISSLPGMEVKGATMPYTSLNGNMFSFLKEGVMALRLGEAERTAFIKKHKTGLYEAYGTVMKEYVVVPASLLKNTKAMKPFLLSSYDYTKSLKHKTTNKK